MTEGVKSHGSTTTEKMLERGGYQLPDSQRKGVEGAGRGDLPDVHREATQELADQLTMVKEATQEDGTLRGVVEWIGSPERNKNIVVLVNLPSEADLIRFPMKKPQAWTQKYDFVRFVEHYGYGPTNIAAMYEKGVTVDVIEEEDDYVLFVPDSRNSIIKRFDDIELQSFVQGNGAILLWMGSFAITIIFLGFLLGDYPGSPPAPFMPMITIGDALTFFSLSVSTYAVVLMFLGFISGTLHVLFGGSE